ncbi:MAG: hypothetical protein ACRDVL_04540 [Acidimicrobiia bacterium]
MAEITVEPIGDGVYRVIVEKAGSISTHEVTVSQDKAAIQAGVPTEELIEASFLFLLDREPQEAILRRFDLGVIPRYFPEYESRLGEYL